MTKVSLVIAVFLSTLWPGITRAAVPPLVDEVYDFQPNVEPTLFIPRVTGPISIDGRLDDAGWKDAARAVNFTEFFPSDGTKPPINVKTLVTYDDTHLYLAFLVEDDPEAIRASLRDRDEMWSDDYVGIQLDTYGDANWAYFIFANPLGIQGDARFVNGVGEDAGVDLVYESDGQITGKGYQVEMAIPFSSLRFPDAKVQTWRVNFWITHPRKSRSQYSWAAIDRDDACWMCQWGTFTGIKGIRAGKNLELLPSLVGSQVGTLNDEDDPGAGFSTGKPGSDMGLGIKYMITPNIVADVAFNPDFSQVEADVAQIDVNQTFALFYPERRPFFQEGGDLFQTYSRVVYTRSINDPSVAVKLTSRFNRLNLAYMGALDEHAPIILPFEEQSTALSTNLKSTTNILRAKRSFGEESFIGALITDRRLDGGGSGSVYSADGLIKFLKNYRLEWQLIASHTREIGDPTLTEEEEIDDIRFGPQGYSAVLDGEEFWGHSAYLTLQRRAKHWSFMTSYHMRSPTFRADNGFINRNNHHNMFFWQNYTFYPENSFFNRISPSLVGYVSYNYDGLTKEVLLQPEIFLNLKGQINTWMGWMVVNNEQFAGHFHKNVQRFRWNLNSNYSDLLQGGFFIDIGKWINRDTDNPIVGPGYTLSLWATIKPTQRLIIHPELNYSRLNYPTDLADFPADFELPEDFEGTLEELAGTEIFSGYILRTRVNYQFTKRFFLRLIVQYDEFDDVLDIDPLLTYRINPFSAFYIGSALGYMDYGGSTGVAQTDRTYFFKFQYLFSL